MDDRTHLPALHLHALAVDDDTVELDGGRVVPDPFRVAGVPQRLVLVVHRQGRFYVGTLTTWEYHEIIVHRTNPYDGKPEQAYEMVVDQSHPHTEEVVLGMSQRPTAAALVAELVETLRVMVPRLAGRARRMPPRPVKHYDDASRRHGVQRSAE
jgi:hypothetical protein